MIAENKPGNLGLPNPSKVKKGRGPGKPFVKGCKPGPGNPFGGKLEKLRAAVINAVTPEDFRAIARKWVLLARSGDIHAGEALWDRILGKTTPEERGSLADALKILAEVQARHEGEDL